MVQFLFSLELSTLTCVKMVCRLCGKAGHSIRTCSLPGASWVRKLKNVAGDKQIQKGRKPPKFGGPVYKKLRQKKRAQYSGKQWQKKVNKDRKKAEQKKKSAVCGVAALEAARGLLDEGYISPPAVCPTCECGSCSDLFLLQRACLVFSKARLCLCIIRS